MPVRVLECTFTVGNNGALKIPSSVLREMGLIPGDHVRIAYLTKDGQQNSYQEFLLSADPLDKLSDEQQIQVPDHLLADANIPTNADLQIICLDGCIVICQDSALSSDELASVLEQLQVAGELTSPLSRNPEQMQEQLEELINRYQEGADPNEV